MAGVLVVMNVSLGRKRAKEFCIDNLLVRIHFIIVMIGWTGLAPREFEFSFSGSLTSTFLGEGRSRPALSQSDSGSTIWMRERLQLLQGLT